MKLTTIMELYELKDSREFRAAKQLEEALNDYGFDYKKFTEAIPHMHPTLQQNLYRLIRECILFMADKNNRYIDLRNRAHQLLTSYIVAFSLNKTKSKR